MRLRRNQLCPIHRSLACCGREPVPIERRSRQMGVRRVDDPQHPRGYREIRSNAEMRKLMDRKIAAQDGICALCKGQFTDYSDIVPDHINPRGMGGAWRDDHPDNIQAAHWWCNGEKGSSRV
jgi:5-methylcytosine-specific restriction endonuclease McrA